MTQLEVEVLLTGIRAIVREELAAAKRRRGPPRLPAVVPPALLGLEDWLRGAEGARDREGRRYVTQRDALEALGVPPERWESWRGAVRGELARLGWKAGPRVYPNGRGGPRVVPYYAPEG